MVKTDSHSYSVGFFGVAQSLLVNKYKIYDKEMISQKKGFSEKQENAQNCQKLPCNRQWIDLGICDGITNSCVADEKNCTMVLT